MNPQSDPVALVALVERIAKLEERIAGIGAILVEREKQVVVALDGINKATEKAEEAQLRVNSTQNEFRGALRDAQDRLSSKSELDSATQRAVAAEMALEGRLGSLERAAAASVASVEGRDRGAQPLNSIWMLVVAAGIAIIAGVVAARFGVPK